MNRDRVSGVLLIAVAILGAVVMLLHPTGLGHPGTEDGGDLARMSVLVHGLALFVTPAMFLGLLGAARRLGPSDLSIASLVAFGFGGAAVMGAATASGFVAPGVVSSIVAANGSRVPDAFLVYTMLWNQGFAKVNVVAYAVGIVLFSSAILSTGRLARSAGIGGIVVGALVLVFFFAGHLRLDVHGFGIVTFLEGAWLAWIGVLLLR